MHVNRTERGATLVLFALLLSVLVLVVALVVDLSFVRNTRQDSKSLSDTATSAGAQALASDGVPRPWRGVCAAFDYVRANEPSRTFTVTYRDGNGNTVAGNPCSGLLTQTCVANTRSSWAWLRATDGDYVVDIRSGYQTPDAAFPEDVAAYSGDNGTSAQGFCDQLAVIIGQVDPAFFGGIAGRSDYDTAIRTVGRVTIEQQSLGVPAFLILERRKCDVLTQSVGASEGGIIVEPASLTEPGIIHVDSSGEDASCGGGAAGNYTLYSTELGSSPKRPGVIAKPSGDGTVTGIIALRAIAVGNTDNAYATAAGISPTPVAGGTTSREPVDTKYNPTTGPTISNLHASARVLATATSAPDASWRTLAGGECSNLTGTVTEAKIFINCPGGFSAGNQLVLANATEVVSNGPISVANNKALFLPAATEVVVGGDSSAGLDVDGGGRFGLGSTVFGDDDLAVANSCGSDAAGPRVARLTVFGGGATGGTEGAMNLGGRSAFCRTAVYLAGPKSLSAYARQAITDGSYDATCTAVKPCPRTTSNVATNAHFIISGYVRWTAPNTTTSQPLPGSVGVEDLALWTESANKSEVKSGGVLDVRGVFFLPNSRLETRSPAAVTPRDAQFIAQSLQLLQGTLSMKPTAGNNVQVPVLASVALVR